MNELREWIRCNFRPARYLLHTADWCAVKHTCERRLHARFTWREFAEAFGEAGIRDGRTPNGDWAFCADPESPFFRKYRFARRKNNA